MIKYTALIRTFNSAGTLSATLASLQQQTWPPSEYVFVDSGSTDQTLSLLPDHAIVRKYTGDRFNFSDALNQGTARVSTEFVLIISSHTALTDPSALEAGVTLLASEDRIGAAYFSLEPLTEPRYTLIDGRTFTGFNGLWNTCALIKVALLRKRGFRPEVFSAEDQEWASWLFAHEHKAVACINGAGVRIDNPRRWSRKKRLNEYVAIAYYSNRRLLEWKNICVVARDVLWQDGASKQTGRLFNLLLLWRLIACRFKAPTGQSKYF